VRAARVCVAGTSAGWCPEACPAAGVGPHRTIAGRAAEPDPFSTQREQQQVPHGCIHVPRWMKAEDNGNYEFATNH